MRTLLFCLLVLACFAAPCRAAELRLSIQDGRVSVDAQDVTIRQILTEWARIGQTRIVNIDRLSEARVTLKFDEIPEKQALDMILRAVPGYVAAPRGAFVANASMYDTILIMATTTAVASIRPTGARPVGAPGAAGGITRLMQMQQAQGAQQVVIPEPADDPMDDPALAAAAAAGLIPVPAASPGQVSVATPLMMPGGGVPPPPQAESNTPDTPTPSNPWNAPVGTPMPGLAAPPAPATVPSPVLGPRPPQADR